MLKGISKWKRLLAIILTVVMLFTNNYSVINAFAQDEQPATNLQLNASLRVNTGDTVVDAGEKFEYVLEYTVPESSSGSEYTGSLLRFTLPEYVELTKDAHGNYVINGEDFESISYNEDTKEYALYFKSKLTKYRTNTLVIEMMTRNLVTPDAIELDFDEFTFLTSIQVDGTSQDVAMDVEAGTITTNAESNWKITKTNTTANGDFNYRKIGTGTNATFEVTYQVKVQDAHKDGIDRLGRLGFESYKVVDMLPTNLPAGGAAKQIKDVKLIRGTGAVALTDADYSVVNTNGHPTSIIFNTYDVIKEGETSQYLELGDLTNTTYEYTVVYPFAPYTTTGDTPEEDVLVYNLVNTATLEYKLVGQDAAQMSDTAEVNISAYEDNVANADVSVTKYVQFKNGVPELLDAAAATKYNFTNDNTVKFTLYTDEACTKIAYNIQRQQMQNVAVNENGVAVFNQIRKGTYYIKEVSNHVGWQNADVLKVVIDDSANVTYYKLEVVDGVKTYVATEAKAVNTATAINAVEFTKVGTDAYGVESSGLEGATFTLTNKDTNETYPATSDANGTVRFNNIPDGNYTLKETAVSDALKEKGYEASTESMDVEVTGGVVVYPEWDGHNKYQNTSNKGILIINKVDELNNTVKLPDAVFEVYGPYATQAEAEAAKTNPAANKLATTLTTLSNGQAVSNPLEQGHYVLVETKAPAHYAIGGPTVVNVEACTQKSVQITNRPQAVVSFSKKGAANNQSARVQELAGVQFELYDADGERLYGVADENGNYTDVSIVSTGRVPVVITTALDGSGLSVSNTVMLSPGTYQYKEVFVPDTYPYTAPEILVRFTVNQVAGEDGQWVTSQTQTVWNYLQWGTIRIHKVNANNAGLDGAEFGVYETKEEAESGNRDNAVDIITTQTYVENGVEYVGVGYSDEPLILGKTYWVRELTAPAGYLLDKTPRQVTMTADDPQVELTLRNDLSVSIQITKVNSKNTSQTLEGAVFGLYTLENGEHKLVEQKTTNKDGVVTFSELKPSTTYYYKEITAPDGYMIVDGNFKPITTESEGAVEVSVTNEPKPSIQITKVSTKNADLKLEGAVFALYTKNGDTYTEIARKTTGADGIVTFDKLEPNTTYYYEEISAPAGYMIVTKGPQEIKTGANGVKTVTAKNEPTPSIQIKKVDKTTGVTLKGATFALYTKSGETYTKVAEATTGDDGLVTFTSYKVGDTTVYLEPSTTYYYKEISAPEGYYFEETDPQPITTGANGMATEEVENEASVSIKITKVDSEYGSIKLQGAKFALYTKEGDTYTQVGETKTTDSSGVVIFSGLKPETAYYYQETEAPAGYKILDSIKDQYVAITTEKTGAVEATVKNEHDLSVKIVKVEKGTNKLLAGATFALYTSQSATAKIAEGTTDANGVVTFKYYTADGKTVALKPNTTYYYKEVSAPAGYYYEDTGYHEIKTGTTGEKSVTVENVKPVSIQLIKVDSTDNTVKLQGVSFALYTKSGETYTQVGETKTTNADGVVTFDNLKPDTTYYYKEIATLDGYIADTNYNEVTTNSDTAKTVTVENDPKPSIQITKVDSLNPDVKLQGAVFAIYTLENGEYKQVGESKTTGVDGVVTFDKLDPNTTYYYHEISAPEGYVTDSGYYPVDFEGSHIAYITAKNAPKATFELHKEKENGDNFANVEFALIEVVNAANGSADFTGKLADSNFVSTDASGNASFTDLVPGDYWLVEVAPNGYQTGKANGEAVKEGSDWKVVKVGTTEYFYKKVTVTAGQNIDGYNKPQNEEIVNYKSGQIKIEKYEANANGDVNTSKPITNVEFTVYSDAECTEVVTTLKIGADGSVTSDYLAAGTYYIKETKVPDGYVISNEVYEVTVTGGQITVSDKSGALLQIANPKRGYFYINKTAVYGQNNPVEEPLEGATFQLYKYENGAFATTNPVTIDMSGTSQGYSGPLDPGIYMIRETVTPAGFNTAPDSLVRINPDGTVEFAEWSEGVDVNSVTWRTSKVEVDEIEIDQITIDNHAQNPRFWLYKYTKGTNTGLSGATFKVYVVAADDDAAATTYTINGQDVRLKSYVVNNSQLTLTTESNGAILTTKLAPGYTYYIQETQAPANHYFREAEAWQSVTIPAEDFEAAYSVTFENYPLVDIWGTKYQQNGTTPLGGATLALFDNEDDAQDMLDRLQNTYNEATKPLTQITDANKSAWKILQTATSDAEGKFTFTGLVHGKTYYIVEVVAPSGYQLEKIDGNYFYYKVVVADFDSYSASAPFSAVYKGNTEQTNAVLAVENDAKYRIQLEKKQIFNGAESYLDGAAFTIYASKTVDGVLVPDTNKSLGTLGRIEAGKFQSGLLPEGTYWLCETTIPSGYSEATRTGDDFVTIEGVRYYKVVLGRTENNTHFVTNPVYNAKYGQFILKKTDSLTDENVVATFKLEKVDDSSFTAVTFTTPADGVHTSAPLAPGLYKLTETAADGYTVSTTPIYILIESGKITDGSVGTAETDGVNAYQPATDGAGTDNPIVVTNVPQGKFFIHKIGEWMDQTENLANVTFDVYVKETENFADDKAKADEEASVDEEDVVDGSGAVDRITTDEAGIGESKLLDAGTYWVVETGITGNKAGEYTQDTYEAFTVTVVAGQTSDVTEDDANICEVENASKYGKFTVTKKDNLDNTLLSNVTFEIYNNVACTGKAVGTMEKNGNGVYTSPRLPAGTYYLKETVVESDEYTNNLNKVFGPYTVGVQTVTEGGTIKNQRDKSLTVTKYENRNNENTDIVIKDVTFGLYTTMEAAVAATATQPGNPIDGVKTTGADGVAFWDNLPDGTYYLRELSAPDAYLLPENAEENVDTIVINGKNQDTDSFAYTRDVYNVLLGSFELDKVIVWTYGNNEELDPGMNISFDVYEGTTVTGDPIATLTTSASGQKLGWLSHRLPGGDYVLVEKVSAVGNADNAYAKPAAVANDGKGNYIDADGNIHIRVVAGEHNAVFTGENAVRNAANYGRFRLFKKAYSDNDKTASVGLSGAQYLLEKYDKIEKEWVVQGTITVNDNGSQGEYNSGLLTPGTYRVTETKAPDPVSNGSEEVRFTIDPTPKVFEIKAATIAEIVHHDGIYRNLKVTKKTDSINGNQPLDHVTFELYKAAASATKGEYAYNGNFETLATYVDGGIIGEAKTTGDDGVVVFTDLEPGKYVLVETAAPAGYSLKYAVIEIAKSKSYVDLVQTYEMVNTSVMGRIVIRKEDTNGNLITKDTAKNAEFKIYAENDTELKTALATVTVNNTGYATTDLLDAYKFYWVVETKAPEGYTLDDRLLPLKKLVYVTGDQNPVLNFDAVSDTATTGYFDRVTFQNGEKVNMGSVYHSIQKLVRVAGETNFRDDFAKSLDSLMFKAVTAEFKITNLFNSTQRNEIPLAKFTVTDETMKFMDKNGAEIESLAEPTSDDYVMNYITVGKAINKDASKIVSAKVYAKVGGEWYLVETLDDISTISAPVQVDLYENATGFKVEYYNADVGFSPKDITVNVTFKQRESNPNVPQVRKVENTAVLDWEDTSLDENGEPKHQTGSISDVAAVTFPAYDAKIPTLALKNDIINRPTNGKYYSGGTIDFETVGSVPATSPADLEHPVMSINLPPYTSLDTTKYSEEQGGINGIRATIDGVVCDFEIEKIEETDAKGRKYEKYILDFGKDFDLPKGKSIMLEYTANISLDVPDTTLSIESRGFIGSAKQLPLTAENPTGMSYKHAESDSSAVVSTDGGFDDALKALGNDIAGGHLTYLRRPVSVELTRTDSRLIRKYVSVNGVDWKTTETPIVKPGDNYYYKLTLVNGGDPVRRIRMIDILPFDGDTQEFRAMSGGTIMSRATNLPFGAGFEQVELVKVAPEYGENMKVTVYYYVEAEDVTENVANRDWTVDNRKYKSATVDLPMLTSNASATKVWEGWTTTAPADMRSVTAIGFEVEYLNGTSLDGGDQYSVVLTMRAPGYTAEQMHLYQEWQKEEVVIANTTAATVTGVGAADTSAVTAVDRVSSNEVYTKLYITTGAIGDYAFYDNNDNGIQDEGDIPARNIPVKLYRRKSTTTMTEEPKWELYKTTKTDQTTGKYWFDELPCNYLDPRVDATAKDFDPTDPANYIGSTYFEYRVEFGIPDGYAATIREAGDDRAVDSNINEFGVTDPVTLALTVNSKGKLEGEINPTIDAGYVKLVNLGDYVWIDYDKNGVQDEGEIGLNGTTVNLYKLESNKDTIEGKLPYRTTTTDTKDGKDGYYLFELLPKGYYVVEFDLTTVDKHTGYTTKYAFTVNDAGSNGADSDAAFVRDKDGQVMYTEVIHLTEDDMTWDAGVTVYSALGGFVFDDQDYNDTQSIPTEVDEETTANGIPLVGTVVTLYKVNEDGTLNPERVGRQTVGEDGRYFFDKLDAGRYKVHFDYPDEYIGVKVGVGDYLHDSETKFFDDSTLNSGFTDIIELPVDTADLTHDAGAYLLSSIGDYVWEDIDRDGIQDEDEAPVKDITVTLQQKLGDGEWTTIETTVTDKNGLYLFEGLKSSDHYDVQYRVAFAIPLTVELTGDNIGENRAEDSNALPELDVEYGYFTNNVKPPYGEDDLTIDAGLYYKDGLCEVGDYVWYDDDKDGVQDKDEKGVEGIVVVLEKCTSDDIRDEDAWEFVAKTETDENGKYIFKGLEAGRYRIAFGLGEPWIVTVSRVGDAALDSDAIRQVEDYYYTSAFFLNVGDSDMTWDAGIYKPTIIVVPPTTKPTEPSTETTEPPTETTVPPTETTEPPTETTEPPTETTEPPTETTVPPTEPTEPDPIIPSTGDSFNMAIWMAIMLSAVTMLAILLKKVTK